ncbi:MAG: tryptophan synthase subunit alpha [Ignavibacterium album]|uniref:tryptophan synthase subunit alpha n=1 Tax=Ignavibacterium album TaxID=591197 RepID=UPI0026EA58D6|nr:tryptophan synthase subunit alpha [Ignavibacterium album]MCX8105831.1 tryptophan synthase subunit alpha [Ignavibacterium album]
MSRIESTIKNEIANGRKVLSVFLTAGFPSVKGFTDLVLKTFDAGADMIEIGIPFSDPIADGPVIQYSSHSALEQGVNIEKVLQIVSEIRNHSDKPIILMGYANPILNFGLSSFFSTCNEVKVDGLIIPDIPLEEYDSFFDSTVKDIDTIMLVSPTSEHRRIKMIGEKSKGFVYCVSVKGITGERNSVSQESINYIRRVKSILPDKKILVGFGVSSPEIASKFASISDGVIVGSAVIKLLTENKQAEMIDLVRGTKNKLIIKKLIG